MRRREGSERGAVAVMVAVVATVLFLVAALVVDLGLARDIRRQSQNSSDAAALAAGNALYTPLNVPDFAMAVTEAKTYSLVNFGIPLTAWNSCTDPDKLSYVPPGSTPCVSFDSSTSPSKVRVLMPSKTFNTGLGTLAGVNTITISSSARAALVPGGTVDCGLCVLGQGPHSIINGDVQSGGAGVHFNGSVSTGPNGEVCSGTLNAAGQCLPPTGGVGVQSGASGNFTPAAVVNGLEIQDPLKDSLSLPPAPMPTMTPAKSDPCTQGPGWYPNDVNFGNGLCTLTSGTYVIAGTWELKNTTNLVGAGVSIYATCKTGSTVRTCGPTNAESGGTFNRKNGNMTISAPLTGPLKGLAIVYDRLNNSPVDLQGNGMSTLTGSIYAPASMLYVNGGSGNTITGGTVIVNSVYSNGNGTYLTLIGGNTASWTKPPEGLHLDQ